MDNVVVFVHGLRTDSKAYALANKVYQILINDSEAKAVEYFTSEAKLHHLKYWEQLAISHCVGGLVKDGTDYHCIICAKPCQDVACKDCDNFVKSLKKRG